MAKICMITFMIMCAFCSAFLLNKMKADNSGLAIWSETNQKLDKIISIMEK